MLHVAMEHASIGHCVLSKACVQPANRVCHRMDLPENVGHSEGGDLDCSISSTVTACVIGA